MTYSQDYVACQATANHCEWDSERNVYWCYTFTDLVRHWDYCSRVTNRADEDPPTGEKKPLNWPKNPAEKDSEDTNYMGL